jgi:heat shock factor-binding protein 1
MSDRLQGKKFDEIPDDPTTKELNSFVQNLLKQMQERFDDMQNTIVNRIDDMGIILFSMHRQTH